LKPFKDYLINLGLEGKGLDFRHLQTNNNMSADHFKLIAKQPLHQSLASVSRVPDPTLFQRVCAGERRRWFYSTAFAALFLVPMPRVQT
jgi:hypothetical protein